MNKSSNLLRCGMPLSHAYIHCHFHVDIKGVRAVYWGRDSFEELTKVKDVLRFFFWYIITSIAVFVPCRIP